MHAEDVFILSVHSDGSGKDIYDLLDKSVVEGLVHEISEYCHEGA